MPSPLKWARVALGWLAMTLVVLLTRTAAAREPDVELFTREGCPRCEEAKEAVRALAEKHPELIVRLTDVQRDPEARRRLSELVRERNVGAASVPSIVVHGTLIVGWSKDSTPARIEALLAGASSTGDEERGESCSAEEATPCDQPPPPGELVLPVFGRVDVKALGLPTFTLAIGLVDGFNPCAMWVLLLLLSLLVNLESRRKMALVAGVFVVVSGLAYYAFMAAWLNAFLLIGISRAVQVALGLIAIVVGSIHVKDFFALHRGVSLSIPERAKPGIYARIRRIVTAEHLVAALAAASVLAVMVNTIELLCTAGLPALYTQVLVAQGLSPAGRYAYLALYIVAYMADDIAMVVLAVVTLGRRKLQERGGRWLKLVSGGVIVIVGALLVVRPQWLAWR